MVLFVRLGCEGATEEVEVEMLSRREAKSKASQESLQIVRIIMSW